MKGECKSCQFARWEWTKGARPRINSKFAGHCMFEIDIHTLLQLIPISADRLGVCRLSASNRGIWTDDKDCPVWEPKKKEPK